MEKSNGGINNSSEGKDASLTVGMCGIMLFPVILVILFLMLFVYKTYKTTLQRLLVYYIILSLCFALSEALKITGAFTEIHRRWACNVLQYLFISSQFAWYMYIAAVANFSLFLAINLTRMRGRCLSKQSNSYVECICVISAIVTGLMIASVVEIYNHALKLECALVSANRFPTKFWIIYSSLYVGMDLEVILVSFSLCALFCFIRQRIRNRKTAILLRNSVINVAVNASLVGLDSVRVRYYVHRWSTLSRYEFNASESTFVYTTLDVIFTLGISVAVIVQAVLCIQTSMERNTCCKRCCCTLKEDQHYAAIDGKDTCTATNPASSRISPPSYTNFPIPYTGGFTQITASINSDGESEQRPLIECD